MGQQLGTCLKSCIINISLLFELTHVMSIYFIFYFSSISPSSSTCYTTVHTVPCEKNAHAINSMSRQVAMCLKSSIIDLPPPFKF